MRVTAKGSVIPLETIIFSTTYGMTENSVLNLCQYFHVTKGLVPNIMHDILEGTDIFI